MGFSGGGGGIGVQITNTPAASQVLETTSVTQAAWTTPPGGPPSGTAGGDLGSTYPNPTVLKINGTALPVTIGNGGTGAATAQAAMNAIAGGVTNAQYLRGNGTNVVLAGIVAGDVPTLNQSTTGNAATATNLAGGATLPAFLAPAAATALTFGTNMTPNAALGNDFTVTLTASTGTFANPTNPTAWQIMRIHVTQGTGGNFTISSFGTAYDFGTAGQPTLSTAQAAVDIFGFIYNPTLAKWCFLGLPNGF